MKTIKFKKLYFTILICVLVLNTHTLVHAAQTIPGAERLEEGIAAYEHGEYDDAIFKLEMAVYQIIEKNKESLWNAHFYLGLSYCLTGDDKEANNEFRKAQEIFDKKLPDLNLHSPKVVKLFKMAGNEFSDSQKILKGNQRKKITRPPVLQRLAQPFSNKVLIETSKGNITIKLYEKDAPLTVKNFLSYVSEGFYNNLIFHRVIPNFMIQGGGFDSKMNQKPTRDPIKNEARRGLKNKRGTIVMARTNVINSATVQFFINLVNNDFLNHKDNSSSGFGYAVFGEVIEGMDVVDRIGRTRTHVFGMFRDVPVETVVIKRVRVLEQL